MEQKGYILTSNYWDQTNGHQLKFCGVSDDGPFEILVDNTKPLFFVERSANVNGLFERKEVPLKSFSGSAIDALYFPTQKSLLDAKAHFSTSGVRTFESDVRPPERFLMERFINASFEFKGEVSSEKNGIKVYKNPQMKAASYKPNFKVMSFDIETSMGSDLFSIAIHHWDHLNLDVQKVFMVGELEDTEEVFFFKTEKEVYLAFEKAVQELDPDIIIGWHVIGFDLHFLEKKCISWKIDMRLGRAKAKIQITERKGAGWFAKTEGRIVIDGPPAMRNAFYSFEDFKLDTVANVLLGTSKDISSTGLEKVAEIERRFHEDKMALAKYNLQDCILVSDIYKKTGLIDLIFKRTRISGMLMDRVGVSTAAFDHFFLPKIHRNGFVGPNIMDISRESQAAGGYVLEPEAGFHENVIVLDFKSLYPSIIKTFKIDPYSRLMAETEPIETPVGIKFSRTKHILPNFIDELLSLRAIAKSENDEHLSQAIKILMNSFYGVMGSGGSRFYHADLPTAITGTGQWVLRKAIEFFQKEQYEIIYGDTDSLFIKLKDNEKMRPFEKAKVLAEKGTVFMTELLRKEFNVESALEIEYEKYYRKFFLPVTRGGGAGAKKKYAGILFSEQGQENLSFSGMEFVRSDWTGVAKEFQFKLFEMIFAELDFEDFIREFVEKIKNGEYDQKLVYKKRLTKSLEEYTKAQPPHVKAARMLVEKNISVGRDISYVMTRRGPVPLQLDHEDLDYEHYIEKQIRPLADSVLIFFEKNFDNIVVGDQLSLF